MISPLELAPNPQSPMWAQIADWDRRVWASQLNWSRTVKMSALAWSDDEKADHIARDIERETKHREVTGQSMKEIARRALDAAQMLSEGHTSRADLEAVYSRGSRKASLVESFGGDTMRIIEFLSATAEARFHFDPIHNAEAARWGGRVSAPVTDEKAYERVEQPGGTSTGLARPMSTTVPGNWDILLMLAPIADSFAPQQTHLEIVSDTLQLTRTDSKSAVSRLTLDRESGRVSSLQQLHPQTGEIIYINEVQSWRAVETDGLNIEVPERIAGYSARDGSPDNFKDLHQLESVRLNADVGADALLFPVGANVDDLRLGENRVVHYPIKEGQLPSLDELKRLHRQNAPSRLPLLLGASALATSALLWSKTARRE